LAIAVSQFNKNLMHSLDLGLRLKFLFWLGRVRLNKSKVKSNLLNISIREYCKYSIYWEDVFSFVY
jgi:hypothetical protein